MHCERPRGGQVAPATPATPAVPQADGGAATLRNDQPREDAPVAFRRGTACCLRVICTAWAGLVWLPLAGLINEVRERGDQLHKQYAICTAIGFTTAFCLANVFLIPITYFGIAFIRRHGGSLLFLEVVILSLSLIQTIWLLCAYRFSSTRNGVPCKEDDGVS